MQRLREMQHESKKAEFIAEKTGCGYVAALTAIADANGDIHSAIRDIRKKQGIPYEFNDDNEKLLCPCCRALVDDVISRK